MNEQAEEAVAAAEDEGPTGDLEPDQVRDLAEQGAQIIDVRREYEFEAGHVPGARHIEMNDLTAQADSIAQDKPVVFTCRSGSRSGMAAEAFRQGGWDAHNMNGGLTAWAGQGLALEPEGGEVAEQRPV